jgi:hypothetical protein
VPAILIAETNERIKIKPVDGTWRVVLPHRHPAWSEVVAIKHPTYEEARETALEWAEILNAWHRKKLA